MLPDTEPKYIIAKRNLLCNQIIDKK